MTSAHKKSCTASFSVLIPKLAAAGLSGDRQRLELLCLNAIRTFKTDFPEMTNELGDFLANFSPSVGSIRLKTPEPTPTDLDGGLALIRVQPVDDALEPILEERVKEIIGRFLRERKECGLLLSQGFAPPKTLLLKGLPGTGKTMLARWLSKQLGVKLIVLDLATSISSFLGKTGGNLRRSLDYGRSTPCVLLLDEFDAIGKRRDDATEVGELKRIVNVLLKELEDWPLHSVLIAATNHPELLDPAIHRRFDVSLELPLPAEPEREAIIMRSCGRFVDSVPQGFVKAIAPILSGLNASDIEAFSQASVRRHIIENVPLARAFLEGIERRIPSVNLKKDIGPLLKTLQSTTDLSVRDIAELVGKSSSAVQYHLKKE